MMKIQPTLLALVLLAVSGPTRSADSSVTESTDPARVSAVEQAARDVKMRQSQQANGGGTASSASVVSGQTQGGVAYLSGGITVDDRVAMRAQQGRYNLWIATVAKGSGAYLSDAQLRIVDLKNQAVVLDRIADGPWFMLALPTGRYQISATLRDDGATAPQTINQRVEVTQQGHGQAILRFNSSAQVSPDMRSPFRGNPFGTSPATR